MWFYYNVRQALYNTLVYNNALVYSAKANKGFLKVWVHRMREEDSSLYLGVK